MVLAAGPMVLLRPNASSIRLHLLPSPLFQRPASPTASQSHLIPDTAAWTSGQASCQGCGDPSLERCDGVGDVPLGSEGHVPLVCKLREEQLFRSSRHSLLLRG